MKEYLTNQILKALVQLATEHGVEREYLPEIQCQYPKDLSHGDIATNVAMMTAKLFKRKPRQIADMLIAKLEDPKNYFKQVEIAGPGFINIHISDTFWREQLVEIVNAGSDYGRCEPDDSLYTQLEFVSANPTGPLNVVNARAASLGDTLAEIMNYSGIKVQREYLINDHGRQTELFGESIRARVLELEGKNSEIPQGGYEGEYVTELAAELQQELRAKNINPADYPLEEYRRFGIERMTALQRKALEDFRVHYDLWFSELELHKNDEPRDTLAELTSRGATYESEGAVWLRTSEFGADKDDVLVKSTGENTYFLADIAYHRNKFRRGFKRIINIWGPDHHGHITRMKSAVKALGIDPERLIILIAQMVRLKREGEFVKFSKRKGEFFTMTDLMQETSVDTMRYFFIQRRFDSHLDFDIDLAKEQSEKNPVFYIQYAHARICSVFRKGKERRVSFDPKQKPDLSRLAEPLDFQIIKGCYRFPEIAYSAAENFEPHRIGYYLQELCGLFHNYYTHHPILTEDGILTHARLYLIYGLRNVIRTGLKLLGVDAPEKM